MKRIICLLLALMLVLPIAASAEDDELDIEAAASTGQSSRRTGRSCAKSAPTPCAQ